MLYALKHATETAARVWARWPSGGSMTVVCNGQTHGPTTLAAPADFSGVVEVTGLAAGRKYPFAILIDGVERDTGTLKTAPAAGSEFVMGFCSCYHYQRTPTVHHAFDRVFGGRLHAWFFQGDFPYMTKAQGFTGTVSAFGESFQDIELCGDVTDENTVKQNLYAQHRYIWQLPGVREHMRSMPCYLVSDDHERPSDNWDGTMLQANKYHPGTFADLGEVAQMSQWCRDALNIYYEGNPHNADALREVAYPANQQLYYDFVVGDVHVMCCEATEFALAPAPFGSYGAQQIAWLKARLSASKSPWKIINSGKGVTEYNGGTLPAEIIDVYSHITSIGITGVVWIGGDIHCMGVRKDAIMSVRGGPATQDGHVNIPHGYTSGICFKEWGNSSVGPPAPAVGAAAFIHVKPDQDVMTVGILDSRGGVRWSADISPYSNAPIYRRPKI